jgi:hypothetical protein
MQMSHTPLDLSQHTSNFGAKTANDKEFHQLDEQRQEAKANMKKSKKALLAKLAYSSGDPKEFMRLRALERLRRAGRVDKVFAKMDEDGNGFVDFEELKRALSRMGCALTDIEVRQIMYEADKDGDGQISAEEFKDYLDRAFPSADKGGKKQKRKKKPKQQRRQSQLCDIAQSMKLIRTASPSLFKQATRKMFGTSKHAISPSALV